MSAAAATRRSPRRRPTPPPLHRAALLTPRPPSRRAAAKRKASEPARLPKWRKGKDGQGVGAPRRRLPPPAHRAALSPPPPRAPLQRRLHSATGSAISAAKKGKPQPQREANVAAIIASAKKGAFTVVPDGFNKCFFEKASTAFKIYGEKLSGPTRVTLVCKERKVTGGTQYNFKAFLLSNGEQIGGTQSSVYAIGKLIGVIKK